MSNVVGSFGLYDALKQQGYDLPEECVDVELQFPLDGALRLRFLCNVTPEAAKQIGKALIRMAESQK